MKGSISVNGLLLILWMTFCWFALVALELSALENIETQGIPLPVDQLLSVATVIDMTKEVEIIHRLFLVIAMYVLSSRFKPVQ